MKRKTILLLLLVIITSIAFASAQSATPVCAGNSPPPEIVAMSVSNVSTTTISNSAVMAPIIADQMNSTALDINLEVRAGTGPKSDVMVTVSKYLDHLSNYSLTCTDVNTESGIAIASIVDCHCYMNEVTATYLL